MKPPSLSRPAKADIRSIWSYIAQDSVKHADLVAQAILATCDEIARSPGIGHLRLELSDKDVRFVAVSRYDRYSVAYRVKRGRVVIARVIHGAQDLRKLFPI